MPLTLSSLLSTVQATFPFDVIKTRMQATTRNPHPSGYMGKSSDAIIFSEYISTWTTARTTWKAGGWKMFYAGLGPTLIRAVVSPIFCRRHSLLKYKADSSCACLRIFTISLSISQRESRRRSRPIGRPTCSDVR